MRASVAAVPGLLSPDSIVVVQGLSCSEAHRIFPDQGSNPYLLHWQADSLPLSHQGSPSSSFIFASGIPFLMLDSLEMSQSSRPSGKKNESNFRKGKPIFSPHQLSHNTMIITSNDNRQLIYIILHNQFPSLWTFFVFPISDLCGRGKFHFSIFQKHANGPSTGHPDVNSLTFFRIGVRTLSNHNGTRLPCPSLQWDLHCPNLQISTARRRHQGSTREYQDGEAPEIWQ